MNNKRTYSFLDRLLIGFDRAVSGAQGGSGRPNPAQGMSDEPVGGVDKQRSAALMRVNHAGEVAAQALYAGHALVARDAGLSESMLRAAEEEGYHLHWCEARVRELDGRVSYLIPFWYAGSFAIGALAGLSGDKWNLGFVMETERQVVQHLDRHLKRLPEQDAKSRKILQQMREDEAQHATAAETAGAHELPLPLRALMRGCAMVMTSVAYRV